MSERNETNRLEAFSDGVFAIAVTLLVLDIHVPTQLEARPLAVVLLRQWPMYLAFATSFGTIGIMWLNHHRLFGLIRRTDHNLLILNGLLLMGITFVPFPTAVVAEYAGSPDQAVAARLYTGTFVVLAILFNLLWLYASHGGRLLGPDVHPRSVERITRSYRVGPMVYLTAFLLPWVSVPLALLLTGLLAVFFALPERDWFRWGGTGPSG